MLLRNPTMVGFCSHSSHSSSRTRRWCRNFSSECVRNRDKVSVRLSAKGRVRVKVRDRVKVMVKVSVKG